MSIQSERAEAFLRTRYFDSLDGLRCLSIVAVIWHHAAGPKEGLLGRGYLGVNLFFAISGFLITSLLLRERARTGTVDLPAFYMRRSLRIFPLYYLVLMLYTALVLLMERGSAPGQQFLANLPAFATYTSNWFVDLHSGNRVIFYFAWSLATEEQFYFMWPWVVRFAGRWYVPALFMGGLLTIAVIATTGIGLGWFDPKVLLVRVAAGIAPAICFGSLFAVALHREAGFRWADQLLGQIWSAPVTLGVLAVALAIPSTPELLIEALMACLVVACCVRPDHLLRPLLSNRLVRHIGMVSYGMYLLHMLAINASRRMLSAHDGVAVFLVGLALTVLIASLSYRYIERRFLDLKERFQNRRSTVIPVPVAVPAVAQPVPLDGSAESPPG